MEKEIDVELDWSDIDIKEYLNHENRTVHSSIRVLKNAKTASPNIFKVCSNDQCVNKVELTAGRIFTDCLMCRVKVLKEDCTKKCEGRNNVKGHVKNDLEKLLILGVTIDVLIKHFGKEKLSDEKKLSKVEEFMLLLKVINIQYNISTMEVTSIYQLIH